MAIDMRIPEGDKQNFETLQRAFTDRNITLLSAIRKADGKRVSLVCAVNVDKEGDMVFVPLATMVEGNPYEDFENPTE